MKTVRTTTNTMAALLCQLLPAALLLGLAPASGSAADKTQVLFDGKDLAGWRQPTGTWSVAKTVSLDAADPEKFSIAPGQGVLLNCASGHTVDLITEQEFGDMEAHVEFCITRHSNSGIYLMGRYEIQVYDSFGVDKDKYPGIECGGIYPRWINEQDVEGHSPSSTPASRPGNGRLSTSPFARPVLTPAAGRSPTRRVVKVVHNGKVIHENVELNGPTRGPMWEDEKANRPDPSPGRPRTGGLPQFAGKVG